MRVAMTACNVILTKLSSLCLVHFKFLFNRGASVFLNISLGVLEFTVHCGAQQVFLTYSIEFPEPQREDEGISSEVKRLNGPHNAAQ